MSKATDNLGLIVFELAKRCTYVRFNTMNSLISKSLYILRVYKIKNNQSYSIEEMVSEDVLEQIQDPMILVDALIAKLNNMTTLEKKK